MDGYPVNAGDLVYDLLIGAGHVTYADASQIQVDFGGRELVYSPDGTYGTVRRLFWSDPILEIPPKNDRARGLIISLIRTVRNELPQLP